MIQTRFFIGDEPIEYEFDEVDINSAINDLSLLYYEKLHIMPIAIFLSYDLYKAIMTQNARYRLYPMSPAHVTTSMTFHTSVGTVMVKPVQEPKERFIYAGNQAGYENALIDKRFEEIVLGEPSE